MLATLLRDQDHPIKILDLGCLRDELSPPAYEALLSLDLAELYALDVDDQAAARLAHLDGASRIRFFKAVIGDGSRKTFYRCALEFCSSVFEPNHELCARFNQLGEFVRVTGSEPVDTVRLDELDLIPPIDYAKIDIQGAELDAIDHGLAKLGDSLVIELDVSFIEQYRNQPLFFDFAKRLHERGMLFHCFTGYGSRALQPFIPPAGPGAGGKQWIWADAVFVRQLDDWERLPDEKLKKLALILHYVYQSHDFANYALCELDRRHGTSHSVAYREFIKTVPA